MKTVKLGKTLTLIAAGKLLSHSQTLLAQQADFGSKTQDTSNPAPPLLLNQIGYPLDLISPPTQGLLESDDLGDLDTGSKLTDYADQSMGYIWTEELPTPNADGTFPEGVTPPRIDFILSNIRNDRAATVYLGVSTRLADQPIPLRSGNFALDIEGLEIIAAVNISPAQFQAFPNSVGNIHTNTQSIVIPVLLTNLQDPKLAENNLYFQAVVLPPDAGLEEGQASEVDHYMIERVIAGDTDSGSKTTSDGSGSKNTSSDTTTDTTDSGGKAGKQ